MIISLLGLLLFFMRSSPSFFLWRCNALYLAGRASVKTFTGNERLSIIIPVRNEALRLGPLLESLKNFSIEKTEIIFVDDHSTDGTYAFLENFQGLPIQLLRAPAKSDEWVGKSWACWVGAKEATGEFILFTDADTVLIAEHIESAIETAHVFDLDLVSALPYHLTETWWERLIGPFHLLTMSTVDAFDVRVHQRPRRYTFGIGQFLMFKHSTYFHCGGHQGVKSEAGEDIALVRSVLAQNGSYLIWHGLPLYKVRMFATAKDFWNGWLRLQAIGLKLSPLSLTLTAVLIQCGWFGIFYGREQPLFFITGVVLAFYIAYKQKDLGNFSNWGALLYPLSQLLFIVLSLTSLILLVLRRGQIEWRGRRLKA